MMGTQFTVFDGGETVKGGARTSLIDVSMGADRLFPGHFLALATAEQRHISVYGFPKCTFSIPKLTTESKKLCFRILDTF